ncbi:uncharacterized protein Fot_23307 [Forsythia ovata]|uniref:Uncharacterized protein n=1 Tax=Forsythia ovata TaxID=205694 RepID=A0ABD1V0J1_9LAMI
MWVAYDSSDVFHSDAEEYEEAVVDGELNIANYVEVVAEEEIIVSVNGAAKGILHLKHDSICDPNTHHLERNFELVTRYGFTTGIRLASCGFTVSTQNALV